MQTMFHYCDCCRVNKIIRKSKGSSGTDGPLLNMHEMIGCGYLRHGYWLAACAQVPVHTLHKATAMHACTNSIVHAHIPVKCCYMLHACAFKPQTWRELSCLLSHLGNHVTPGG